MSKFVKDTAVGPAPELVSAQGRPLGGRSSVEAMLAYFVELHALSPGDDHATDHVKELRSEMLAYAAAHKDSGYLASTAKEVRWAFESIRANQGPDDCGLKREVLDHLPDDVVEGVAEWLRMILETCRIPAQWLRTQFVPAHKGKGKPLSDPAFFRPIGILGNFQ